ncbi:MAG TPA: glycosyltransferase family 4 protein [Cyclobacteriaceae bacterium]|nr:glycosyltransferase family 4 protein [Cyclobacteriaceae bacterium]
MRKKKLAVVTTHPIQYNAPLFKLLTDRGNIHVKVFYTWSQAQQRVPDKGFAQEIQWDIPLLSGYEYEFVINTARRPGNKNFMGIVTPGLIPAVRGYDPDALLVYGWNFKSHYDAMRYFSGKVPVWFRGDSHLLDEKAGLKTMMRRLALRWVYRSVDKAFYVGTNNKDYFHAHGLREHQLVYAPHAVDQQRFIDSADKMYAKSALSWRQELGYLPEDIVILFAGKFESKKNPTLLIEVFNKYFKDQGKLKLLMVGNGVAEDELRSMATGNENIRFLPFHNQSQMPLLYRVGDVFCLPSKGPGETWGLAVNEALACGLPVIVSEKVGCAKDLICDDDIGWRFDAQEKQQLAGIIQGIRPEQVKDEAKKVKRQTFIQQWSYHSICKPIEENI